MISIDIPVHPHCPACGTELVPYETVFARGVALCCRCGTGQMDPPICHYCQRPWGQYPPINRYESPACAGCGQPIQPKGQPVTFVSVPSPLRILMRALDHHSIRRYLYSAHGLIFWCPPHRSTDSPFAADVYSQIWLETKQPRDLCNDHPDGLSDPDDPPTYPNVNMSAPSNQRSR